MAVVQQSDLKQLQRYPKLIETARNKVQRLRDQAGLHSVSLDGMPHGSGPRDKVGELATEIVMAEEELQQLEDDYWKLRLRVGDWINGIDDITVQLAISLRFLEGMKWERVSQECGMDEGAVRMTVGRYLKKHGC